MECLEHVWTDLLHMRDKYNPWGDDVSCIIFRSIVKKSWSHGSFTFLPCPLCGSMPIWPSFIWGRNTTHEITMCRAPFPGQQIKGQGQTGHLKFLPCLLRRSVPTDRVTSHVAQIQLTHNVMMCHAPFPAQKFRGQGVTQTVRSFCAVRSVWLHAFLIRWISYMTQIQPMRGQCFAHYFQVKNPGHMGRSKFCRVRSVALWLYDPFTTYQAQIQPMSRVISQVKKIKGQGHTDRSYLNCWPLAAKGCCSY